MQPAKKVIELLTQKYISPIVVLGNDNSIQRGIFDSDNATLFTVSDNSLYTFVDKDKNIWTTAPECFTFNNKHYYPITGDEYTRSDGIKYSFVAKDVVIAIATAYFEKFIDKYSGFTISWSVQCFYEHENGNRLRIPLILQKFKSTTHRKIKAYLSFN